MIRVMQVDPNARRRGFCVLAALTFLVASSLSAAAAVGEWQGQGSAQVRLIAAGLDNAGDIAAGIEIALDPGWKTYWRTPGDAGVAPLIDFSASTNIAGPVKVEFPVPHRVDDGYAVSNVYDDYIVLPVSATVIDPQATTMLTLTLDIGVCSEICIPEHYDLTLELAPGESDPAVAAVLTGARGALPGGPVPGVLEADGIVRVGGSDKRPVFEVSVVAPDAAKAELFIEGPADWFPALPKLVASDETHATFSVEFSRLGSKTPIGGNRFTVTIVANGKAIEDTVALD